MLTEKTPRLSYEYKELVMSREKTLYVSALNIKTHPHSSAHYEALFNTLLNMRKPVIMRSEQALLLGSMKRISKGKNGSVLYGYFHRFTDIDFRSRWYNTLSLKPVTPKELEKHKFPPHLRPNFAAFRFAFFPQHHRLVFEEKNEENKTLSPRAIQRALEKLCADRYIEEKFGKVDIIVEPARETLSKIFSTPRLYKLHMFISLPNPDDQSEAEAKVFRRLKNQNARTFEETLSTTRGDTLAPNNETKELAAVAASNGTVEATGVNENGKTVKKSTVDHPLRAVISFNPKVQAAADAFLHVARDVYERLLGPR